MFKDILEQHKASLNEYYNVKLNDLKDGLKTYLTDKEVLFITINKHIMDNKLGYDNNIIKDSAEIAEDFGHKCEVLFSYNVPNDYFYNIYTKNDNYLNEYTL